jgi:uncharacterized protein YqeY
MSLKQQLQDDLKDAMRQRDAVRKRTLRLALSAIKLREVEVGRELEDPEVQTVLQKEAKQRRETLEELEGAGRPDRVAEEEAELAVLHTYLPEQLGRAEIAQEAREVIDELGAKGPGQMGQVMGVLMSQLKGQADGKLVSQVVRELLMEKAE